MLSVRLDQTHLAERPSSLPGDFQELRGNLHPDDPSIGSDFFSELEKGLPGATSDIENDVSRIWTQSFDGSQPER